MKLSYFYLSLLTFISPSSSKPLKGLELPRAVAASTVATITSPSSATAVPIPKTIVSLSIEFCYITDYLGDVNKPNLLSLQLLQNIQDLTGSPPTIRVGGDTQDHTKYCATCSDTLTNVFAAGNTEAVSTTYNHNLFTVLNNNVPSNQKYIFGLNLKSANETIAQQEAQAANKYLNPARLISYELGNEPDLYGSLNIQTYSDRQESWIKQIDGVIGTQKWQLGALARSAGGQGNFSLQELVTLKVPQAVGASSLSDHAYPYSICSASSAAKVSLPNLMSHTNTVSYFSQWSSAIAAAKSIGLPFYMGETGSVSCHGKVNVSNTLGAALWELDYVLNGARLGMSGVYFHMGSPFFYSMWQPAYNGTAAHVNPTYYAALLIANSLSPLSSPTLLTLVSPSSTPNLVAYALYTSASKTPSKIIILNLNYYSFSSTTSRPAQIVDLSSIIGSSVATASRLTAPGADSTSGVTFGGQSWENKGVVSGTKVVEKVAGGKVSVGDSEAVVVSIG